MPIDRDGDGPPLRRQQSKVSLTPGEGRSGDLRATPFTDEVFDDDYYGRRPRRAEGSRSLSVVVGIVLGIAVAGGAGYYFLHGSGMTLTPGEISFVKADPTPYKIRPDNPGGMQVENQDKLVYDRVAKGNAPARVENLLPPAEEPKAPPMKPKEEAPKVEEPKAAAAPEPVKEPVKEAPAPAKEPEVAKEEPKPAAGKPVQLVPQAAAPAKSEAAKPEADPLAAAVAAATGGREAATGPIASPAPAPKAAAPAPVAPPAPVAEAPRPAPVSAPVAEAPKVEPPKAEPPKPVQTVTATPTPPVNPPVAGGTGVYQIQLASVLSEQAALAEWGRISNKNKDILGSYSPTVVRADLGEKGVFYRLRAGPLADKAAADALCASLTAANVGCIVVKP